MSEQPSKTPFVLEWCKYELRLFLWRKYIFFWMTRIVTSVVETLKSSRVLNSHSNPCCILCLYVLSLMCVWWTTNLFFGERFAAYTLILRKQKYLGFFPPLSHPHTSFFIVSALITIYLKGPFSFCTEHKTFNYLWCNCLGGIRMHVSCFTRQKKRGNEKRRRMTKHKQR